VSLLITGLCRLFTANITGMASNHIAVFLNKKARQRRTGTQYYDVIELALRDVHWSFPIEIGELEFG